MTGAEDVQIANWMEYVATLSVPEVVAELMHLNEVYMRLVIPPGPEAPPPVTGPLLLGIMVGLHQRLADLLGRSPVDPNLHACTIVRRAVEADIGWERAEWPCEHVNGAGS